MSSGVESGSDVGIVDDLEIIQEGEVEQPLEIIENEATNENDNGDNADENDEDKKKTVKPKRIIKNPQPKLNEETLKGPRGLSALEKHFDRVKFKGRGHEEQDLNILMKTYEYWCHRLFPKFPFESCIERLEKLGTKRATQVYVKRIRMGIIDEEKALNSDEEEETETPSLLTDGFVDAVNDPFDQLLPSNQPQGELTEDQMEQVRRNKEKAEKLRQERLKKIQEKSIHLLESSNSSVVQSSLGSTQDNSNQDDQTFNSVDDERCELLTRNQSMELSEGQIEQIRKNKEKAEKLRQKRLKLNQEESNELIESYSPILQNNQILTYSDSQSPVSNKVPHQILENETMDAIESNSPILQNNLTTSHNNPHLSVSNADCQTLEYDAIGTMEPHSSILKVATSHNDIQTSILNTDHQTLEGDTRDATHSTHNLTKETLDENEEVDFDHLLGVINADNKKANDSGKNNTSGGQEDMILGEENNDKQP